MNHSQKAEEMLKRIRERLLGGSEECQREGQGTSNLERPNFKNIKVGKGTLYTFYPFFLTFLKKHLLLSDK